MTFPVVLTSGAFPVTEVATGWPVTPVSTVIGGMPVTQVMSGGFPVRIVGADGFVPEALGAAIVGWWDAGDLSTMFTDTALTTPAAIGDAISGLRDKSGTGLHLTQSTSGARPVLNADGTLTFDGSDDFMERTDSTGLPNGTTPGEVFALVRQDALAADATSRMLLSYGGGAAASRRTLQRTVSGGVNRAQALVGNNSTSVAALDPNVDFSGVHVAHAYVTASLVGMALDGGTATTNSVSVNTQTTRIRLGASTATTAASFFNGRVAEILVTTALSVANRAALIAWLLSKRGRMAT